MASTLLTRTPATAGNRNKWTWSSWIKRSNIGSSNSLFGVYYSSGAYQDNLYFQSNGKLDWFIWNNNAYAGRIITDALFRDVSAWYHIVCVYDNTLATATDRMKVYVNGVRETSLNNVTNPVQNSTLSNVNTTNPFKIGDDGNGNNDFDGSMAHVHFIDGLAYQASTFGETDSLTGIWKPITSPSVTYGTNGFFLKFASSGSMGTDSSGNSNNFTVNGNLTQTQDTPSNVFATYNPLGNFFPADTFSNGNTTQTTNAGNYTYNISTLGASNGKYYCEIKNSTNNNNSIGIADRPSISTTNGLTGTTYGWAYVMSGQVYNNGSIVATYNTVTTNDIVGIALDLDNNKVYFSKNGTWQGSSDPSAGTGGISITAPASNRTGFYFFGSGDEATNSAVHNANFGNGYFGTTAVASAGTNASGIGIFEYDVPTGYTALSTKGLNL